MAGAAGAVLSGAADVPGFALTGAGVVGAAAATCGGAAGLADDAAGALPADVVPVPGPPEGGAPSVVSKAPISSCRLAEGAVPGCGVIPACGAGAAPGTGVTGSLRPDSA